MKSSFYDRTMPTSDTYRTIIKPGHSELRIKASRFFGYAEGIQSEEEADTCRAQLKKEFYDAAHQPFAYRLYDGTERSSDDGEPKGTSGISILKQIATAELFNIQIVVVRYFGGTKLGKGGLARAFSEAAELAIGNAMVKTIQLTRSLELTLPHDAVNTAKQIMTKFEAEMEQIQFAEVAFLKYNIPLSRYEDCKRIILERFGEGVIS